MATKSANAKRLNLDADQVYEYLSRTVFGREKLEAVITAEPMATRLPVVVAGEGMAIYAPEEMSKWDYLDVVETAIEEASALEPRVLPAAVMLAYMKPSAE